MQYTSKTLKNEAIIFGIDLLPIQIPHQNYNNIFTIQGDILKWNYYEYLLNTKKQMESTNNNNWKYLNYGFHHIISDIAPNLTGIKDLDDENVYNICSKIVDISKDIGC